MSLRSARRLSLGLWAALALLGTVPVGAAAHASLESASPADGAELSHAPREVVFRFGEAVEGRFGAVKVFDHRGVRVDVGQAGHVGGLPNTFGTSLPRPLPRGQYVATYRVVSADGHPVSGGVVFSVGDSAAATAPSLRNLLGGTESGSVTRAGFATVRALDDLAIALALGLMVFLLGCWRPALGEVAGAGRDWHRASAALAQTAWRMLRGTVALGAVATALGVVFEGTIAGGSTLWEGLRPAVVADTLDTRFGTVWSAQFVLWAGLGLALLRIAPQRSLVLRPAALGADGQALGRAGLPPVLALALPAAGLALAPALAGHASTQGDASLLVPSAIAHVVAMSIWIGGLVALALLVPRATAALDDPADRSRLLVAVLTRFSPLALAAVITLQLTGTVQSIAYLTSFGDLLHDAFGRMVAVKIVVVLALVALGASNRRRAMPRLAQAATGGGEPATAEVLLRRTIRAELALLVVVLGATGVLTGLAPPGSKAAAMTTTPPAPVTHRLGPIAATASLRPARTGANVLRLWLRDRGGRPFSHSQELTAEASLPGRGVGPLRISLRRVAPGIYVSRRLALVPDGRWRIDVAVRVSVFDQYESNFDVNVTP